jgi:LmbE family N-acetylglucosaminyl deacetylase
MNVPTFSHAAADLFVPDGTPRAAALARTTHLCIAAHADDVEWIGYHGIAHCFDRDDAWFTGVVVSDGAGSPRSGPYAHVDDRRMVELRRDEQRRAALVGAYGAMVQLAHSSADVKQRSNAAATSDLVALLEATRPDVVYLHAPTDRHETHVAVVARAIDALRRVDARARGASAPSGTLHQRPSRVLGVEGWGDLDWLAPADRVELDVGARPHLAAALVGVFDSQIAGGKRYDLAMEARRVAHATFASPRAVDGARGLALAIDLTAAARADGPSLSAVVDGLLARFGAATRARLAPFTE